MNTCDIEITEGEKTVQWSSWCAVALLTFLKIISSIFKDFTI